MQPQNGFIPNAQYPEMYDNSYGYGPVQGQVYTPQYSPNIQPIGVNMKSNW